jgi:hypothetical protein
LAEANDVLQSQREWLGADPYPYGLAANATTVERLVTYEHLLGLIDEQPSAASLFAADGGTP